MSSQQHLTALEWEQIHTSGLKAACLFSSVLEYFCVSVSHFMQLSISIKSWKPPFVWRSVEERETERVKRITLFRHPAGMKRKDSILSPTAAHEGQTIHWCLENTHHLPSHFQAPTNTHICRHTHLQYEHSRRSAYAAQTPVIKINVKRSLSSSRWD